MQFTQLVIIAMATMASARPPPEQTIGEFKFLGNVLKVFCPDNKASIKCYDTMCTIGCGECYQCIKAPNRWEGTSKTTIEFRPDCSGKCYDNRKPYRKEPKYPPKEDGYGSSGYAEYPPKYGYGRNGRKPGNAVVDGMQRMGYAQDYA